MFSRPAAAFAASRAAGAQIISENTRRYGLSNAPGLVEIGGAEGLEDSLSGSSKISVPGILKLRTCSCYVS